MKTLLLTILTFLALLTTGNLQAQVSGTWDAASMTGATGYNNYGNGVIRLLDVNNSNNCQGAAVHETSTLYNPTSGSFSKCFQLFFGCPGGDEIGNNTDTKGDGMAFSFSDCNAGSYNINNGACGGGLGYHGACGKMITVEFDTYSSMGNSGFDNSYGGGTSGNHDELAVHFGGQGLDANRLTSVDAGNLEDGLEHMVCISYTPGTRILAVTIDGNTILSYDLGPTYNLQTYFGNVGLMQTWSSGKYGATNPTTVSDLTADISTQIGAPLCPAGVVVTSPSDGAIFAGCAVGAINLTASATAPAGNTVTNVEFLVDGVVVGSDNTAPYAYTWNSPSQGAHAITAKAYYSGGSNSTSTAVNITVGGGLNLTSTAPVLGGSVDAIWSSYPSTTLTKFNGATGNDLSASYKIMYDANYLYVLVDVTDDVPNTTGGLNWEKDGVEIYIDYGNHKLPCCTYGGDDFQYNFIYDGTFVETKHSATGGVSVGKFNKAGPTGYIMEMRFAWSTLGGPPTAGTYLGFDVSVNDDDNGGTRDNQNSWNDGTFGEWENPSKFGTLQFSNCNPLPVSVITFTGELINEAVVLNWITAGEINNQKFVIERSSNLTEWEAIGEVAGAGNSTQILHYSFTDHSFPGGLVYYRLRQVDFDGAAAYTNIIAVQTGGTISISPNPFDDQLAINSSIKGDLEVSIYDVLGRLLYQVNAKNENGTVHIHPELSSGAYLITVRSDTFIEQQKIIKK